MKKVQQIYDAPPMHWVGNGFAVQSLFSYHDQAQDFSPFLLADYAAPRHFEPSNERRGVGEHPHRGFETVTLVYAGEVEHRDSSGGGGTIGPGDVQWMTAASGILHQEFHSQNFTGRGGLMEMVQLWVNLPAAHKGAPPRYQTILQSQIPRLELEDGAGFIRVIAGEWLGRRGPAETFSELNVWDVALKPTRSFRCEFPAGHTLAVIILRGRVEAGGHTARVSQLLRFEREGGEVRIDASEESKFLVLSGKPLEEPVVGYGPFVMNSRSEIAQAMADFNAGRLHAGAAAPGAAMQGASTLSLSASAPGA